jgi:hypothetical protein
MDIYFQDHYIIMGEWENSGMRESRRLLTTRLRLMLRLRLTALKRMQFITTGTLAIFQIICRKFGNYFSASLHN